jgi:cytochrome P450
VSWLQAAEDAHRQAVAAAVAGMSDPALGDARLGGTGVAVVAEAAVSSATPFLRAPLLASMGEVLRLHPPVDLAGAARCTTCDVPAPCATRIVLSGHGALATRQD